MSRRMADTLKLRAPLPDLQGVSDLGIRAVYPTNAPDGWTVALLRLPNDYYVVVGHQPYDQWAAVYRHYVVPGTRVEDPRDGRGISSVLRALAPLDRVDSGADLPNTHS